MKILLIDPDDFDVIYKSFVEMADKVPNQIDYDTHVMIEWIKDLKVKLYMAYVDKKPVGFLTTGIHVLPTGYKVYFLYWLYIKPNAPIKLYKMFQDLWEREATLAGCDSIRTGTPRAKFIQRLGRTGYNLRCYEIEKVLKKGDQ